MPIPGGSLWTTTQGAGLPAVLCHGGPGLSDNLGPLAALVDDRLEVHRYDQRGAGRSTAGGPFDVASSIADLERLRHHWGHQRWLVGGHSWGATLALLYALAHPDRVFGVVSLSGTGLRWGWQEETRRHRLARLSSAEREELVDLGALGDALAGDDRARFLRLTWQTDFVDPERAAEVLDREPLYAFPRDDVVFRELSASLRETLAGPIEQAVRTLGCPLVAIHGAEDADPDRARRVADLAPRGRLALIDGAGHSPWLERPEAVAAAIRGLVDDVGR